MEHLAGCGLDGQGGRGGRQTRSPPTRVTAAHRFCPPCHLLKTRGWLVSEPDADLSIVLNAAPTAAIIGDAVAQILKD